MFDVIIPSKDTRDHYLTTCLDSVVAQTFTDWHCYVVSTAEISPTIRRAYPADKFTWLLQDESHRFVAGARNQGATAGSNLI